MSPPDLVPSSRRNTSAENGISVQTTEQLVRSTGVLLCRAGIAFSRPRISRMVRGWRGDLTADGSDYIAYLADNLRLSVQQRRDVADQYRRVIAYSDPTGETAVRNVMRTSA